VTHQTDLLLIELGAIVLGLAVVARLARRVGMPALPLYLLVGLAFGEGGLVELPASADFIETGAEIGLILMLLMLGVEFSVRELVVNVRSNALAGIADFALNFTPGLVAGLLLDFGPLVAVLLGGVTYISSSGIVAKLVADLNRIGNHETSVVLSILVIEDLAMVFYLPIISGVIFGSSAVATILAVSVSLAAVLLVLGTAWVFGDRLSGFALSQSSEALLLTLLGITLLVAGVAERINLSSAVGAFVVGVALSGEIVSHARGLLLPLRNLFAAVFFVFFGLHVDPGLIADVALVAGVLAVVTGFIALPLGGYGGIGEFLFDHAHGPHAFAFDPLWAGAGALLALAGLIAGLRLYDGPSARVDAIRERFAGVHRLLVNRFYMDHAYQWAVDQLVLRTSQALALFDRRVVNDRGVNGPAQGVAETGRRLRRHVTGLFADYGAGMIAGVGALALLLWLRA